MKNAECPCLSLIRGHFVASAQAHWSQWSNWTACSASCGEGMRQRSRECDASGAAVNRVGSCIGPNVQKETCEDVPCPGK